MTLDTPRARTAVFFNDACYEHRFIRTRDTSQIVERPERLRALKVGLAAALARLEESKEDTAVVPEKKDADDLVAALEKLDIAAEQSSRVRAVDIVQSTSSADLLDHPAVKYIHGDINGDVYLEKLVKLAKESEAAIARGESEIPQNLSQGDLYLCPGSLDAIQGSLGTVCEAVDLVINSSRQTAIKAEGQSTDGAGPSVEKTTQAFVAVRPPGHHCGEDSPSGFCFVNNVAVAAAHAHLKHGITKVAILDIDLHHGNGTQSIVWQINEDAYRKELEPSDEKSNSDLKIYYGSLHDILSYPCEDGNAALIQAASTSIDGPHGQHIENVHLLPYSNEDEFWDELYTKRYAKILQKAEDFLRDNDSDKSLVIISCGFDACEHEYASMSRHGRKVPVAFYHRFAQDARSLAKKCTRGKIVSVLEGGYSDRALLSGAFAHLCGLADADQKANHDWWNVDNLIKLEKLIKRKKSAKLSFAGPDSADKWLERTASVLSLIDVVPSPPLIQRSQLPAATSMTLRERKPPTISSRQSSFRESPKAKTANTNANANGKAKSTAPAPVQQIVLDVTTSGSANKGPGMTVPLSDSSNTVSSLSDGDRGIVSNVNVKIEEAKVEIMQPNPVEMPKKLPRVILRVKDPSELTRSAE